MRKRWMPLCAAAATSVLCLLVIGESPTLGAVITPGNLVVVRVGDGSAALSANSTATFLEERTPTGTLVQTITLPTAASGSNQPLTLSGSATSEGFLKLSTNGQYLTMAGYAVAPGTAAPATAVPTAVARGLARVDLAGNVDTSNMFNQTADAFNGSNPRSAISTNGTDIWMAGNAGSGQGASAGVRYTSFGSNASTRVDATSSNMRVVNIFNNQLYVSSNTGSLLGVSTVGTGLPTAASSASTTLLPGMPSSGTHSPYDFLFSDANTLYVADDGGATSGGGIQKWTQSGGTWSLAYTLLNNGTATTSVRGLTSALDASNNVVLYGTTTTGSLISVTDLGAASTASVLATAATNTTFRGVTFIPVPEPTSLALIGVASATLLSRRRRA